MNTTQLAQQNILSYCNNTWYVHTFFIMRKQHEAENNQSEEQFPSFSKSSLGHLKELRHDISGHFFDSLKYS